MVKKEIIKEVIDEISRERESVSKSYSHKPHLASLPYDLNTNDLSKIEERIDEINKRVKENNKEIKESNKIANQYKDKVNDILDNCKDAFIEISNNKFDAFSKNYEYADKEDEKTIHNDWDKYINNINNANKLFDKLNTQIEDVLKNPNKSINESDLKNYQEITKTMENGIARLMRLYNWDEPGNSQIKELYKNIRTLNVEANDINMGSAFIERYKVSKSNANNLTKINTDYNEHKGRIKEKLDTRIDKTNEDTKHTKLRIDSAKNEIKNLKKEANKLEKIENQGFSSGDSYENSVIESQLSGGAERIRNNSIPKVEQKIEEYQNHIKENQKELQNINKLLNKL